MIYTQRSRVSLATAKQFNNPTTLFCLTVVVELMEIRGLKLPSSQSQRDLRTHGDPGSLSICDIYIIFTGL